jgi:hypothetical protein
MITFKFARKTFAFAGVLALAAIATVVPFDAFAQVTNDVADTARIAATQASNVAKLIAVISYVIGAAMGVKTVMVLKAAIQEPDGDTNFAQAIAYGVATVMLILLPYGFKLAQNSLGAGNDTVSSSASNYEQDSSASFL